MTFVTIKTPAVYITVRQLRAPLRKALSAMLNLSSAR